MAGKMVSVRLKIRRYDASDPPEVVEKMFECNVNDDFATLKEKMYEVCEIESEAHKVFKLRCADEVLVPLSFLLDPVDPNQFFYVDVCKVNYTSAHINAVCKRLEKMESRIANAEMLLPQLEWRRQAQVEDTVNTLSSRVSFLNRRVDELMPEEWKLKMAQSTT